MKTRFVLAAITISAVLTAQQAFAALADFRTVESVGNDQLTVRLYRESGVPSPASPGLFDPPGTPGDTYWLVAAGPDNTLEPITTSGVGGDDLLIAALAVDGAGGLFPTAGVATASGLALPDEVLDDDAYVVLFNQNFGGNPLAGQTYGTGQLNVEVPAGLGNYIYRLEVDLLANTAIVAVPEPGTYALILAGAAIILAIRRRRQKA